MRAVRVLTGLALATVTVTACGRATVADQGQRANPGVVLVGNVETLHPGALTADDISAAQRTFALELLKATCGKDGANTLLSPASAFNALGMLDAATAGTTTTAISRLLHLPGWTPDVVAAVRDHQAALAGVNGVGAMLHTSDRVWPDLAVTPTQRFLDDVRTAYGASLQPLDFAGHPGPATDAINKQVAKDTDGLIPTLFDQPLSRATTGVLTDAIVLKALWQEPFEKLTDKGQFATAAGSTATTMMAAAKPASYSAAGGWQAAQMSYQLGTLAAVALLPPRGAASCSLPAAQAFSELLSPGKQRTSVNLPLLHLDQTHDLLGTLGAMGLPLHGDYSGLAGSDIAAVVQKDVMTVDELGTVAAGATGIAVEASAAAQPEHELSFDRPFLLVLEDTATHSPLFLAWVGDPNHR